MPRKGPRRPQRKPKERERFFGTSSALPAWLNASLASPTSWGELVGGPHPWHTVFRMAWADEDETGDHDDLRRLRGFVRAVLMGWGEDLEGTAWRQVTTDELIRLLTGWLQAEVGRLTLAPLGGFNPYQQEPSASRFFLETLIRYAERSTRTDGSLAERLSLPLALSAALAPGPWLLPELARRQGQHLPGTAAALTRICTAIERADGVGAEDVTVELREVDHARTEASRYLKGGIRRSMAARGWSPDVVEERVLDAAAEQFVVVEQKWGHLDPFEALSAALEGRLDIVSRAVADRLSRQATTEETRHAPEIAFDFHAEEAPHDDDGADSAESASIRRLVREFVLSTDRRRVTDAQLAAAFTAIEADEHLNPQLRRYLRARRSGRDQTQAAADVGVTTRTARNHQKRIRELLNEQGFSVSSAGRAR